MLKPLTTTFSVVGNGFNSLKQIKKSYDNLKKNFKNGNADIGKSFKNLGNNFLNGVVNKIKNGAVKVGNAFKVMSARSEGALDKLRNKGNSLLGTFGKITALLGGGFAVKTAFDGATATEMNRTAIMSMSGEKRADELMGFGINFANTTPFQTSEVLEGIKKLEIRGLKPEEWLRGVGDMSAMLGKSLDQGIEAVLDAVTGEFERLKEFGLTSKMLQELFPTRFDKKGAITDLKGFIDDLMKYLTKKYKGGMETLSNTTTGLLSTIKGVYGSFTNMLLSGTATGEILEKSPLGRLKTEILQPLQADMIKWNEDGTFQKWSEDFGKCFDRVYAKGKKLVSLIFKFRKAVLGLIGVFAGMKVFVGIVTGITKVIGAISTVIKGVTLLAKGVAFLMKGVSVVVASLGALTTPVGLIVTFITSLGVFTTLLIKNAEKIKDAFLGISYYVREFWENLKEVITSMPKVLWESVVNLPRELGNSFKRGWENIKSMFGFSSDKKVEEEKPNGELITENNTSTRLNTISNHSNVINFTINGTTNPEEIAKQIQDELYRREIAGGKI